MRLLNCVRFSVVREWLVVAAKNLCREYHGNRHQSAGGFRVQADAGKQNAEKLTPEEIRRLFPDEEIAEAAGVLEMISQTPEQLILYNARLKFQRDEEARIIQARLEGEARGEARGRQEGEEIGQARGLKLGRITLLHELLGIRPSTAEEFAGYDEAQLNTMAEQLQRQLRSRR